MTDRTPMEALLERMWGNAERKHQVFAVRNVDAETPVPFIDRYIRKTHPTSPRKGRRP